MTGDGPAYREFNFSPSGEWAAYAFRGYRDAAERELDPVPEIRVRSMTDHVELDAGISGDDLGIGHATRMGLSAVVEDTSGELSYWALRHPPGKPDFHHADAFALQLVPGRMNFPIGPAAGGPR